MQKHRFFDEVHDYQRFVRQNISMVGNYTIISEQLPMRGNEVGILDMLAVDNDEKRLVILELKNEVTTDKNSWQPLRYYDLARRAEDDLKLLLHRASDKLKHNVDEINLMPKLVLVVPECNQQLLRTLAYFEDIDSLVVELNRYDNGKYYEVRKTKHYPFTIFHKEDLVTVSDKISKIWNMVEYRKCGINNFKLELAETIIRQLRAVFKDQKFDVFYNETRITITLNGKVWGHLFVKQRPLDSNLTMNFKIPEDLGFHINNLFYQPGVQSFEVQKNKLKLKLSDKIPDILIEKLK